MNAAYRLSKAKTHLMLLEPFFANIIMRMNMHEVPDEFFKDHPPTMATNGRELFYATSFVDACNDKQLLGVLKHEVYHCVFLHPARVNGRDHDKWNIAADYSINLLLDPSELPNFVMQTKNGPVDFKPLRDEKYNTPNGPMSADEIYSKLPSNSCPVHGKSGKSGKDGKSGSSSSEGSCSESSGDCGDSGDCDGHSHGPSDKKCTCGRMGDFMAGASEEELRQRVIEAYTAAKMAGKVPGGLEILIEDLVNPKVPWEALLTKFVTDTAKNDYNFKNPNRRHIGRGVYLPEMKSNELGKLVFLVDTSGSMMGEDIIEVYSELDALLDMFDTELIVAGVDCDMQSVDVIKEISELKLKGQGGTSFSPGFRYVSEHQYDAQATIYLTDGYASDFGDPPDMPVLWVITSNGDKNFNPPFGQVVHM